MRARYADSSAHSPSLQATLPAAVNDKHHSRAKDQCGSTECTHRTKMVAPDCVCTLGAEWLITRYSIVYAAIREGVSSDYNPK